MATPQTEISYSSEVYRKALHLMALVIPLGMWVLGRQVSILVLVPSALFALSADYLRVRSAGFNGFIHRYFGFMMRAEEQPQVGDEVVINGATWVLVSAATLILIFPLTVAVPAFVLFMLGDAAAALVGRRIGRIPWGIGGRTVEGSLAFLIVALIVVALFPGLPFWVGAVAALVACLVEVLPGPFNDNLRVPLVAAFVLFLLQRFVLGLDLSLFAWG